MYTYLIYINNLDIFIFSNCIKIKFSDLNHTLKCCFFSQYLLLYIIFSMQFVPIRNFLGRGGDDVATVQERLAKEVLEEIPDQFLSYMQRHNIMPKPPLQRQSTISSVHSLPPSEL